MAAGKGYGLNVIDAGTTNREETRTFIAINRPQPPAAPPAAGPKMSETYLAMNLQGWPQPPMPPKQPLANWTNSKYKSSSSSLKTSSSKAQRCCSCTCLFDVLLPALGVMFVCGVVLLPSAVYFIPREFLHAVNNTSTSDTAQGSGLELEVELGAGPGNCSQGFVLVDEVTVWEDGSCVPSCEGFRLDAGVYGYSVYGLVVMVAGALGCAATLGFIAMAVTCRRKKLLSFPRIYSVYMCATSAIIAVLFLVGAVRPDLYCSSDSLVTSRLANGTSFCTITGVLFSYTSVQLVLWTGSLSVPLLWAVAWPDSYNRSKKAGYLRLLHSMSVVMALVVPMVPSLIQLEEGFQGVGVPALLCLGRNSSYTFYALSLILSVFSVVPTTGLVLVGWAMLKRICGPVKVTVLSRCVQLKTLLVILYSVLTTLSITCFLMYYFIYSDIMSEELTNRFTCESSAGSLNCPGSTTEHVDVFQKVLTTSMVLMSLVPLVLLALNTELKCCRKGPQKRTKSSFKGYT